MEAGKEIDLNPMRNHNRFRFMFTTHLVDRDIPQTLYEERTMKEKIVYNVKYPEDDEEIQEGPYSWIVHRLRKHIPINKENPYGYYPSSDEEDWTLESVASKNVKTTIDAADEILTKRQKTENHIFVEQLVRFKQQKRAESRNLQMRKEIEPESQSDQDSRE